MSFLMERAETMAAAARENLANQIDRISMDAVDPYYRDSRDNWGELLDALRSVKVRLFVRGNLYGVETSASGLTDLYTQTALDAAGAANETDEDPAIFTASVIAYA